MRTAELNHQELLELDPESGVIRFAGQRALLLDAVAVGLLRKSLVESFGTAAARTVLTQFGFAHGWRMAEAMKAELTWDSDADWAAAGDRIHALQGLFSMKPGSAGDLSAGGATLLSSYEVEHYMLHFGRADEPVCWTICGLISGYISRTSGMDIYVLESSCAAKGDAACHLQGKTRAAWGAAREIDLRFFQPTQLQDCLDVSIRHVVETLKASEAMLREHRRRYVHVAPDVEEPLGIIARSAAMRKVMDVARRVAKVDSTVLITGESGTGKERIARLLHDESARVLGPFIAINCGAITESLLESELFGHARGAFTGATSDRPGLFEAANGGTLLLDEVGELSAGMQVKLLRVLQEREVRRVGENKSRKVDVRVLSATNRDPAQIVADGTFRQDLYYRLRVVELHVPALRLRRDDVLPLARVLLAEASHRMKRPITGLTPEAADQLLRYTWPGNVRELENAMERAVALAQGARIEIEDLPEEVRQASQNLVVALGGVQPLSELERQYIVAALAQNEGNQTHTAEQLQIGTATLYRKLKSYGLIGTLAATRKSTRPPGA